MPVYSRLPQGSCHLRESNAPYLAMLVYEALAKRILNSELSFPYISCQCKTSKPSLHR